MTIASRMPGETELSRAIFLAALLLFAPTCGPQNTPILILLSGDLAEAEGVQITPWLNERKGAIISHDLRQNQRVLWIPESERGTLRLEAAGTSSKSRACISHATAEVPVEPGFTKPIAVTLDFGPAQCQLTVELQGIDSVTSQPAGIDCHGAVVCSGWFPRGQQVVLKAGTRPSSRYAQWSGACQAPGPSCTITVNTASKAQVRDTRGICSDGDWCWQSPLPQGSTLRSLWGTDASSIWSVTDSGTIVKWNGTAWSLQSSSTSNYFTGLWGTDANNIWAVGYGGNIVKWNGTAWSPQSSGTSDLLWAVWGTDSANVWAVGDGGTILKWNGIAWSPQSSGTSNKLHGVWGTDSANVWAVGDGGTILKGDYDPPIRTYTDLRMEISCQLPASPNQVMSAFRTQAETLT